jgi:hypothetical protein
MCLFLQGFLKDIAFVPPLSANPRDLRNQITAAVVLLIPDKPTPVWGEWIITRICAVSAEWAHGA